MSAISPADAPMNAPRPLPDLHEQAVDRALALFNATRARVEQSLVMRREAVQHRRETLTARRAASAEGLARLEEQLVNARRWDAQSAAELAEFERIEAPQGEYPDPDAAFDHQQARDALTALDPAHSALSEPT